MLSILATLASANAYVTYVITRSEFPLALAWRDRVFRRWGEGSWQSYLVTCCWCTAFYTAGIMTLVTSLVTDVPLPVLIWWGVAGLTGLLLEVVETMWSSRT